MPPTVTAASEFRLLSGERRAAGGVANRVGIALLYVWCTGVALAASGCGDDDGVTPGIDAGSRDDDGGGTHGALLVVSVTGDLGSLEDGQVLESASLSMSELTARNDRGGTFEPMTSTPTTIDLAVGATFELRDATPATYARVTMHLAPNGSSPSFAMRIAEASRARTFDVQLTTALDVEASCASPIVLAPGGTAELRVIMHIRELARQLDEGPEPTPVDGVVHVDEGETPDTANALLTKLQEAFELQCESSTEGSG